MAPPSACQPGQRPPRAPPTTARPSTARRAPWRLDHKPVGEMTKALCLAPAAALLATTSVHAASDLAQKAGAAPTAVVTPAPGATLRRPAIALFGLYSWGGFGLGAR